MDKHYDVPSSRPAYPQPVPAQRRPVDKCPPHPPPEYRPPIPDPIISGYLDKATEDSNKGQVWVKKYVEVADGIFRFFNSREEKHDASAEINLTEALVSLIGRKVIRLEPAPPFQWKIGRRVFKACTETVAYRWFSVISKYSKVTPTAECWCKKLSGGKAVFEERHIRLTGEGRLSWYKSDREDAEIRSSVHVRGSLVTINPEQRSELWVETKERKYVFVLIDSQETERWHRIISWHACRPYAGQYSMTDTMERGKKKSH